MDLRSSRRVHRDFLVNALGRFGCHGIQIDQLAMVYMVKFAVFKQMACERSAGGSIGWIHLIFHRHVATGQFTKPSVFGKH